MLKVKVYNTEGKEVGEVKLEPKIFEVKANAGLVMQSVRTQMANKRVAVAHSKDRSEVRGGGRKPWKQKGTGRARHGSIRSPIWKGGGVTFGPQSDRNYELKLNKKAKKKALFMVLTDKAKDGKIIILDKLELVKIKTKQIVHILAKLKVKKTALLITGKNDEKVKKSVRNISGAKLLNADSLNIIDILNFQYLVITKDSLDVIKKTYLR
ncbi:MAG: 50S ribosomal protein L4 [Patescibacteria group bacterium]|jgi:large subunit ribosomal protein L4